MIYSCSVIMFILKASKILYTECLKKIWLNKWNFIVSLLCRTALYIGQPKWVVWIFCPNTKVETGYPDASFKSKSLASHFLSDTFIFFLGCLNFVVHSLQKGKICRKNFFLIFFFFPSSHLFSFSWKWLPCWIWLKACCTPNENWFLGII